LLIDPRLLYRSVPGTGSDLTGSEKLLTASELLDMSAVALTGLEKLLITPKLLDRSAVALTGLETLLIAPKLLDRSVSVLREGLRSCLQPAVFCFEKQGVGGRVRGSSPQVRGL
jgi:hypothetical protein